MVAMPFMRRLIGDIVIVASPSRAVRASGPLAIMGAAPATWAPEPPPIMLLIMAIIPCMPPMALCPAPATLPGADAGVWTCGLLPSGAAAAPGMFMTGVGVGWGTCPLPGIGIGMGAAFIPGMLFICWSIKFIWSSTTCHW